MAITIKQRGKKHTFIYYYKDEQGSSQQQYEAYSTEEEAAKRVSVVEFLKENQDDATLLKLVNEYNDNKKGKKTVHNSKSKNLKTKFADFIWIWAPKHARKKKLKPSSFRQMKDNIRNHLIPYFGEMIVDEITHEDIDNFLDEMGQKKCKGPKSYNKEDGEIPALKSSSVIKAYNYLSPAFRYAKQWGYASENPICREEQAPSVTYGERNYWSRDRIKAALDNISDPVLHLAFHMVFVCSLRPGELTGMDIGSINLSGDTLWVKQTLIRVYEEDLEELAPEDVYKIFPKKKKTSKTVLILKDPKTDNSKRFGYFNETLRNEIIERFAQIERDKSYYGEEYHDYGLLICYPNGDPIETRRMVKKFKAWQKDFGVPEEEMIDIQGARLSASTYKLLLTNHDLKVVAGDNGNLPATTAKHYDRSLEEMRRRTAKMVADDIYSDGTTKDQSNISLDAILEVLSNDQELAARVYAEYPILQQAT